MWNANDRVYRRLSACGTTLSEIKSLFCQLAWLFVVGGYKTQGVCH